MKIRWTVLTVTRLGNQKEVKFGKRRSVVSLSDYFVLAASSRRRRRKCKKWQTKPDLAEVE